MSDEPANDDVTEPNDRSDSDEPGRDTAAPEHLEGAAEAGDHGEPAPVDELPADLDLTTLELPYLFPNNNRRRLAAVLYVAVAVVFAAVWLVGGDSPRVNGGFLVGAIAVAAFGAYAFASGWNLSVDEVDALAIAGATADFPVGHASAQLAWRGWLGRPTWRMLVYSHEDPQPAQRGLVFVDGVSGEVLGSIIEPNPEDWSQFDTTKPGADVT